MLRIRSVKCMYQLIRRISLCARCVQRVSVVLGREVVDDESAFDRAIMIGGPGVAESPPS